MNFAKLPCAIALIASCALACATLSVEEEEALGAQEQRIIQQHYTMFRDRMVLTYLRELGAELVESAPPSAFEMRFYMIEDPALNAFAIPGGAIYVNTGLILEVSDESELASVLAHEMAHVTSRHIALQYRRARNTGLFARLAALAAAIFTREPQLGELLAQVGASAYLNTFSQEAEREADALAIEILVNAGYDPYGMIRVFELLQAKAQGPKVPQFLSTHPAPPERIQNVRAAIEALEKSSVSIGDKSDDAGRLEVIQRRIRLIIGASPEIKKSGSAERSVQ